MHCCRACFSVCFALCLFVCCKARFEAGKLGTAHEEKSTENGETAQAPGKKLVHFDRQSFLKYLFKKYGDSNGRITFEGFEHLLENLGLGGIVITDHDVSAHKLTNGSFADLHSDVHPSLGSPSEDGHHDGHSHPHKHPEDSVAGEEPYSVFTAEGDHFHDHELPPTGVDHDVIHHVHHHNNATKGQALIDVEHKSGKKRRSLENGEEHLDLPFGHQCLSPGEIYHVFGLRPGLDTVGSDVFVDLCPALIYELEKKTCRQPKYEFHEEHSDQHGEVNLDTGDDMSSTTQIWLYATLSVIIISMCGLCGVAVVPMMGKWIYGPMLHFLIALAIGTLTGDAFLHLLPQALSQTGTSAHEHGVSESGHGHSHDKRQIWHMLTALGAMLFFFIVENTLPLIMAWRDERKSHKKENDDGNGKKKKRCDLKSHALASDQYRYDNQMVTHYLGEKPCEQQGECEIVQCENIPCSDQSCPPDACLIITEGACGVNRPDHCVPSTSNNNDGHLPCFQHLQVDAAGDAPVVEKRACSPKHSEHGDESRRCSGKWPETDYEASGAAACKRHSLCSTGANADGGSIPMTACSLMKNTASLSCGINANSKELLPMGHVHGHENHGRYSVSVKDDRGSTPCSMDRSGYDPEAHSHDEDGGNTSDDQDEKDVLKKTKKGVHHHHRHHHHHHHHNIKPNSASAVAMMVIAGDGLHNLTDGLAIGAAFAISVWGGISTTVAVFCHELPHEVGDFAMLLATGMGVREALLYNVLSSILCFAGMAAGILMVLGSTNQGDSVVSPWVFAATAGIFLYLALVDMIPELNNSKRTPNNPWARVALQVAGMVTGFGIMFVIAYHEETLHMFLKT